MQRLMHRLFRDRRAATAIEYTLIVAMIATVAIAGFTAAGRSVLNLLGPTSNALT